VRQSKSYLSRTLFYSIQSFCLKMRKALCIQPLGFVALSVILLKSLAFGYLCGFDPHKDGRTAVTDDQIPKWEKNIVNFMFDSTATQEDRKTFAKAIRKIRNANHCLQFKQISSASHAGKSGKYMLVKRQGACGSDPNCFNGATCTLGAYSPTVLNLHCFCIDSKYQDSIGLMIHEIFHGLGFHHTQTRPDRDQYIKIHKGNVAQKYLKDFETNFQKCERCTNEGPYDCESIMHYHPAIMIKRNLLYRCKRLKKNCVISAKTKSCEKKLFINGQKNHDKMSANDIRRLKSMYKC